MDMKLELVVIPVADVELDPAATTYASSPDLAAALRRAAATHGEHETRIGAADPDRPTWYAAYMVAEQAGADLPQ